ncbi:MAG: protein kinase domain-containing protein, partial [Thermoanaerobaculia bacterium]
MSLPPGTRLGRYEVREPLGAGGMGEVYSAYDHTLEREIAIKVLRSGTAEDSDRMRRFVQEAKAASALNHPNVAHVYDAGVHEGLRFIAMEIVEGETLRDRLARGPLPIDDALTIGLQITAALAAAHKAGIVHRDVKPENVIIHPDGYAKVLDFGIAKLRDPRGDSDATVVKTGTGIAVGTFGYMAPEQMTGGEITPAADVFSLGVVLYEMVSGHRPDGKPLHDVPPKLDAVITKAMASSAAARYPSAVEMLEDLRRITRELVITATTPKSRKSWAVIAAAIGLLIVIAAGAWMFLRSKRTKDAQQMITRAEQLYAQRKVPEAYDVATQAAAILPGDDRLVDLITKTTQKVTIKTDPPGATVYLQRFKGPVARQRAGTTPLEFPRLLRADYLVTVEKEGYAPMTRPLSIAPMWNRDFEIGRMPGTLQIKMLPAKSVPHNMVFVGGGPYRLQGWYRASDREVKVSDFFIDRYEVSNRDFEEFVRAGGYRRVELWKQRSGSAPATSAFVDTTGLPGPRNWAGGAPPAGHENDPVTGVTWYEAAAFAEWGGKKLPTIYQWEKAGRYPGTRGAATNFPWGFVAEG